MMTRNQIQTAQSLTLSSMLRTLPVQDQTVLRDRFGLDAGHPVPHGEIAAKLHVSVPAVVQMEKKALERLASTLTPSQAAQAMALLS